MEKDTKVSNKIFKVLVVIFIVLVVLGMALSLYIKSIEKKEQEAYTRSVMPVIEERIERFADGNKDIASVTYHFEYDGANFIELYVADTWFNSTNIEKKRFAKAVRDNVKAILFEEGFIKADDRVGIYVYSVDGIELAESNMYGEIKLKD